MKKILVIMALAALSVAAAAQSVTKDSLGFRTAAAGNVAELLRGQIAGVRVSSIDGNPVGGLNVNIRGINSLRTDNQPLWIVDGVMVSTELDENLDAFWQYGEKSYTAPLNPLAFLNAADIESIEVLKDISATAIYGARGANGVVIIKTRMPKSGESNINWTSNAGIATDASSLGLKAAFNHNHNLSFNGTKGGASYNISGSLRNIKGTLPGNGSQYGSVKANFDTQANKLVWFGLNSIMSVGASSSPTGVAYMGRPSMTLALRDPALSPGTTADDWAADYDDDTKDYRALASTYIRVNLGKSLYFKASGGIDFQSNRRVIWYGAATDFGAPSADNQYGGAASTLTSQLLGLNGKAELTFNRYFGANHHVTATLAGEVVGNMNKFNTMNGINFVTHALRGNGLKFGAYDVRIHTFRHNYFHYGAYGFVNYDYKKAAGISATYRFDNTPKYLGNEVRFYPSVEG